MILDSVQLRGIKEVYARKRSERFSQGSPGDRWRSLISEKVSLVCSKRLSLGLLAGVLRELLSHLGSKGPKRHQLLYRERQSLPLSAGRTMSLNPEAREERNGTLIKMDSLGSSRQKPNMMNRESSGDS